MAKYGKWIGGFIGLVAGGPLGALAGFVLGSLFDENDNNEKYINNDTYGYGHSAYQSAKSQAGYQSRTSYEEQQRNTFLFSLLVLASYIIRADGKVMHSEMNLVRRWLRTNFGERAVDEGVQIMYKLFDQQKFQGATAFRSMVMGSCQQLQQLITYEQRLQLLDFLVKIAKADGTVAAAEIDALRECSLALGLSQADLDSMLSLQDAGSNLDAAYKVLGVSPTATNDELKAAYRRQALQNHPDKVASLGEDVRKAAEKKFQEINAAKETIWKARKL